MPIPRISVIIGAYNAARTIRATLDSVLAQTVPPDEILVMDDGSGDDTAAILNSYRPRVTVLQQMNSGCAASRNALLAHATGDMIAFLDSDDIWHPRYLEFQAVAFVRNPTAGLLFSGHIDFEGYGRFHWYDSVQDRSSWTKLMEPAEFIKQYYEDTDPFTSPSYCCVRREPLLLAGPDPFKIEGADDAYFFTLIPLLGWSVVYNPTPLVARRILGSSQSANTLWAKGCTVKVFETLAEGYSQSADSKLRREFEKRFASRTREYAKLLRGAGKTSEARSQLVSSLSIDKNPESMAKSLVLLLLIQLPIPFRPAWSYAGRRAAVIEKHMGIVEPE
jgi:glycosyltransferase involved in cell wall biosynthesis